MPIFRLTKKLVFPSPDMAEEDGLLAVDGDLSVDRLVLAYSMGIFPWYTEDEPLLWWSPDPRLVLLPDDFHVSARLERTIKSGQFSVTFDKAFASVIRGCAEAPRPGQDGTWLMPEMIDAYCGLHQAGYAHSVECWREGKLAGGLYGVSLGKSFFGESMFSRSPNASKVALAALVAKVKAWDFLMIDCQVTTRHLLRLGAREMPRTDFLALLRKGLDAKTRMGSWQGQ